MRIPKINGNAQGGRLEHEREADLSALHRRKSHRAHSDAHATSSPTACELGHAHKRELEYGFRCRWPVGNRWLRVLTIVNRYMWECLCAQTHACIEPRVISRSPPWVFGTTLLEECSLTATGESNQTPMPTANSKSLNPWRGQDGICGPGTEMRRMWCRVSILSR